MSMFELVEQRRFIDERGILNLVETSRELPFSPKRLFWITGVPIGTERGFHAHKSGLQLLFCLKGSIELTLRTHDQVDSVILDDVGPGVWVKNMVWGEQKFLTGDAVLLVLASNEYEEADYIRDFPEFVSLSQKRL